MRPESIPVARPGMGSSPGRLEDENLLFGKACFLDDIPMPGVLHACFVRSPHAHARILSIDTRHAISMPGVIAVFTQSDLFGHITSWKMPVGFSLSGLPEESAPFALAGDEVAFVGEAFAVVIANSRHQAEDAAATVQTKFELLPAVSDCRESVKVGAPPVRLDLKSNVLQDYTLSYGDIDAAFAQAEIVLEERFWTHRGCGHPMEGRGVLANMDAATGTLTVWSSTQMSHELHYTIAHMLDQPEDQLRVITPDVGGGFGVKFMIYPEEIVIPAVVRALGRPVKWVEDRREHFLTTIQERDQYWQVSIAATKDGQVLGLRGNFVHDHGAYIPQGTNVPYNSASSITGPYVISAFSVRAQVAYTNKVSVATIRGAGYPQAAFVMERMMDKLAAAAGLDRLECRRRNFIPPSKIPYEKPLKSRAGVPLVIDSGDFPALQATAVEAIDFNGFETRRQASAERGLLRGIGLGNSVKPTGRGPYESARVRVHPSGRVVIHTGALAMGQGIKTSLAQLCAAQLGLDPVAIEVTAGDTAHISYGMGGFASRQAMMAGSAVSDAAAKVRQKAIKAAAAVLKVDVDNLTLSNGEVHTMDFHHRVSLGRLAMLLKGVPGYAMPIPGDPGLDETVIFHCDAQTYAGSCHACEVEVDPATGGVNIVRYVAVQDCGNLINPQIAHGQIHGGVAHGIGNTLFEWMGYDANGQPLTTTFAEYLLPTATEIPHIEVIFQPSPSPLNPLGAKGIGESSTIAVAAAVISAVEDAVSKLGVRVNEFPLSPVRLLELIDQAQTDTASKSSR